MNDEVIEILDDFEDNTIRIEPIKNVSIGIKQEPVALNNANTTINVEPLSTNNAKPTPAVSNLGVSTPEEIKPKLYTPVKNLEEVKYEPIKPEKEETKIETIDSEEESKSGIGFIVVLFILLAAFIIALPYISKLF